MTPGPFLSTGFVTPISSLVRCHFVSPVSCLGTGAAVAVCFSPEEDCTTAPPLRFEDVPDSVEVRVIDRPGQPFLGTGEAAQGPTAAAIANAVADATGARLRELPMTPDRVKAAISAL